MTTSSPRPVTSWAYYADEIHADNVKAGWWTDLKTGESLLATRDRLNLCMLVVTELNEAYEAYWDDAFDDKLPQYKGVGVELADAQIRLLDMIGAERAAHNLLRRQEVQKSYPGFGKTIIDPIRIGGMAVPYAHIIGYIASAVEHYRKNKIGFAVVKLEDALNFIENLGTYLGFDMHELREAKREFNRNRADHKVENRKAEGGKIF